MAVVSYHIYDDSDGEIRFSGRCDEAGVPKAGPGQTLVLGDAFTNAPHPSAFRIDLTTKQPVPLTTLLPVNEAVEDIKTKCQDAIEAGFVCTALGDKYFYPSKMMPDQLNILFGGNILCLGPTGPDATWARRPHDTQQLASVQAMLVSVRDTALNRRDLLIAQASAAQTKDALDAVQWNQQIPILAQADAAKNDATQTAKVLP